MKDKIQKRCKRCHKTFTLGYTGMANGMCDECNGNTRDTNGFPWKPWETTMELYDVNTEETHIVKRDDAFRK